MLQQAQTFKEEKKTETNVPKQQQHKKNRKHAQHHNNINNSSSNDKNHPHHHSKQAGPTSEPTTQPPQTSPTVNPASTFAEICTHLYQKGFLTGLLSDVSLRAFDQAYHLHRLLLIRSPFFERLILGHHHQPQQQQSEMPPNSVLDLSYISSNKNITPESFSICLAWLYGAPVLNHIKVSNARSVLACSLLFELFELAQHCKLIIIGSISLDTVLDLVSFSNSLVFSSSSCTSSSSSMTMAMDSLSDEIRESCIHYLSFTLPSDLDAFSGSIGGAYGVEGQRKLIGIYASLPFQLLKVVLEDRLAVPGISEFEKYQFAQKILEKRKVRGESVVLIFDKEIRGKMVLNNIGNSGQTMSIGNASNSCSNGSNNKK